MTKKLLGYAPVDSGQLIIIDPCYLSKWKDGESDDLTSHYGKACEKTLKEGGGQILVSNVAGFGVVTGTYDGDGTYPVYAHIDHTGRPTKITIELK